MKIPPGFGDKNKPIPERFGDLIIWYRFLEYSKATKKSIIFVTEDKNKEDWLIKVEGELVPRNSLIQEFYDKTNQFIYIYDFKQFMDESKTYLGIEYNDKTREDVEKLEIYHQMDMQQDIIEFDSVEILDRVRPLAISFVIKFKISGKFDEAGKSLLEEILLNYGKRFVERRSSYEYDIVYLSDNKAVIGIIIHYPVLQWPENESERLKLYDNYATDFINYFSKFRLMIK